MNSLGPLNHWRSGFESHLRHGCLCVYSVCRQRPCDGLIPAQGVLPSEDTIKKLNKRPGPTKGCKAIIINCGFNSLCPLNELKVFKLRTADQFIHMTCTHVFTYLRAVVLMLLLQLSEIMRLSNGEIL
jgi:hypothetical protein